mmetsp:Transcript_70951/g.207926  ORF Transcript_70951/g.207926 Transcript_70951/m.207926 type:complete len:252 (-) Transcript_70951:204-959(-)
MMNTRRSVWVSGRGVGSDEHSRTDGTRCQDRIVHPPWACIVPVTKAESDLRSQGRSHPGVFVQPAAGGCGRCPHTDHPQKAHKQATASWPSRHPRSLQPEPMNSLRIASHHGPRPCEGEAPIETTSRGTSPWCYRHGCPAPNTSQRLPTPPRPAVDHGCPPTPHSICLQCPQLDCNTPLRHCQHHAQCPGIPGFPGSSRRARGSLSSRCCASRQGSVMHGRPNRDFAARSLALKVGYPGAFPRRSRRAART